MPDERSTKALLLNTLDILKQYSDERHRLSQEEIRQRLEIEYGMTVDRKAIKRNLMSLLDCGMDLEYTEVARKGKNGEDSTILTSWYLNRDITDAELRLLIDGLLFSKHIPYSQCKELVEKLAGLSNRYFKARLHHIHKLPEQTPVNKELFYTIETLDEAITTNRKVTFHSVRYGTDKKRHVTMDQSGKPIVHCVSPYQMSATNGRYYLICNRDKFDNAAHYRVDGISGIKLTDQPSRPMETVKGLENRLRLSDYMSEHLYMYAGETVPVTFRADKGIIGAILDWFGMNVVFSDETDSEVTVRLRTNEQAMQYWAMQYFEYVEVLKPASLREKLYNAAEVMRKKYGGVSRE